MKAHLLCAMLVPVLATGAENNPNLSGDWEIISSFGGTIPITVRCTIVQQGQALTGTCSPEMESPQASELAGTVDSNSAHWGYSVVFNGNPGTVDFQADIITANGLLGTLNLSGTQAPFSALRR